MEYKTLDGFCFVCSKADTDLDAKFRAFNCNKELFELCGKHFDILFHTTVIIIETFYIIIVRQTVQKSKESILRRKIVSYTLKTTIQNLKYILTCYFYLDKIILF